MTLVLTQAEIDRYRPYHTMAAFEVGFDDYTAGRMRIGWNAYVDVAGQAYDRGAECAMRRSRISFASAGATRKPREQREAEAHHRRRLDNERFTG